MTNKNKIKPGNEPRKKYTLKRKREATTTEFLNSFKVPLANKFSALTTEEEDITDRPVKETKIKISPIVVTDHNTDIKSITSNLKINCEIKIMSIGRKIFVKTVDDKTKICETLKENSVNFFTHPDNINKVFKAVLTGLPEVNTTEIAECLQATHNITATKVTLFKSESPNKLYLCEFNADEVNMKLLKDVKMVHYHIIKWQPYKPKRKGPTQCHRCLMYGHGASLCARYIACIQCGGNHLTNECNVINSETKNPKYKCFNCASAELPDTHKANDPSCPFRAKYEANKASARTKNTRHPNTRSNDINAQFVPAPAPPPLCSSYATVTNTRANAKPTAPTRAHNQIPTQSAAVPTSANAFTVSTDGNSTLWSFGEVASILFNSIHELKQCKTKLDQLMVITKMLQNACN